MAEKHHPFNPFFHHTTKKRRSLINSIGTRRNRGLYYDFVIVYPLRSFGDVRFHNRREAPHQDLEILKNA